MTGAVPTDPLFLSLAAAAALVTGISKGGFGSGAGFATTTMLALVAPPAVAVGLMLPLLMLVDLGAIWAWRHRWSRREAALLVLGGLPGVAAGILFWRIAPADLIRVAIGVIAIAFVLWQAAGRRGWLRPASYGPGAGPGLTAGAVAGFTSFVSHAGGPAAAMYLLGRGMSKEAYQATSVMAFGAINLMKLPGYAALGLLNAQMIWLCLALAPLALLGTWIGVRAHRLVPERGFFGLIEAALVIGAAKLIWDGLA